MRLFVIYIFLWLLIVTRCYSHSGDTQTVQTEIGRNIQTTKKLLFHHFKSAQQTEGGVPPREKVSLHTHNFMQIMHKVDPCQFNNNTLLCAYNIHQM